MPDTPHVACVQLRQLALPQCMIRTSFKSRLLCAWCLTRSDQDQGAHTGNTPAGLVCAGLPVRTSQKASGRDQLNYEAPVLHCWWLLSFWVATETIMIVLVAHLHPGPGTTLLHAAACCS